MKLRLLQFLAVCLLLNTGLFGDEAPAGLPPDQLDQLYGPIALYPDALVAIILPASTVPSDVVLAARFLERGGDQTKIDNESWDDSVKSLAHYPDVVKWMDENLTWTKQAGEAFMAQPADVMNSIQRLRAKAKAAGTLVDTPQQQVVIEDNAISIMPTEPDVIYVPSYDPEVVYVERPGFYSDPFLTFGIGYSTGMWLGYDLDWGRRRIWTIDRHDRERYWHDHRDWRRPSFPGRPGYVDRYHHHTWGPRPDFHRPPRPPVNRPHQEVVRPIPFQHGPSNRAPDQRRRRPDATPGDHNSRRSPVDGHGSLTDRRPPGSPPRGPRPQPERAAPAPQASPPAPSTRPAAPPTASVRTPSVRMPQQPRREVEARVNREQGRRGPTENRGIPHGRVVPPPPPAAPRTVPSATIQVRPSQSPPAPAQSRPQSPPQSERGEPRDRGHPRERGR